MSAHIIRNPVPTPEQMAKILGISSERVAAVREIMAKSRAEAGTESAKPNAGTAQKSGTKSKAASKRKGARGKSAAH